MTDLVFKEKCYQLMGACFEVYKQKACGFLESVYQECLAIELEMQSIAFVEQPELSLYYKGRRLQQTFKPDYICFGEIVLEIKAITQLADEHRAQVHNYLKATDLKLGLLVNFGHFPKVQWERIVR